MAGKVFPEGEELGSPGRTRRLTGGRVQVGDWAKGDVYRVPVTEQ